MSTKCLNVHHHPNDLCSLLRSHPDPSHHHHHHHSSPPPSASPRGRSYCCRLKLADIIHDEDVRDGKDLASINPDRWFPEGPRLQEDVQGYLRSSMSTADARLRSSLPPSGVELSCTRRPQLLHVEKRFRPGFPALQHILLVVLGAVVASDILKLNSLVLVAFFLDDRAAIQVLVASWLQSERDGFVERLVLEPVTEVPGVAKGDAA